MRTTFFYTLFGLAACTGLAQASAPDSYQGHALGEETQELRVHDALRRSDGRWLSIGTRQQGTDFRELPYLFLRRADGTPQASLQLQPTNTLSVEYPTLAEIGSDSGVIVAASEYDQMDFTAPRRIVVARLDADLGVVWSRRLELAGASLQATKVIVRGDASQILVLGQTQREREGVADTGDGVLLRLAPADGQLLAAHALGTADFEHLVDAQEQPGGGLVLLTEIRRGGFMTATGGDALLRLDANNQISQATQYIHTIAAGVRARPFALLPRSDGGWTIAGRRTAFGPNFFYLQRVDAAFAAVDQGRSLIPFLNAMDVAARGDGVLIHAEADGESGDEGSVLLALDAQFTLQQARRYPTENLSFPRGALAVHGDDVMLSLGAMVEETAEGYDATQFVGLDGGGTLCGEDGAYDGFQTTTETFSASAWSATVEPLTLSVSAWPLGITPLARRELSACATADRLFADGLER